MRQRLDRLTPAARDLLHIAAVIGRDIDSSLLLRAAGRGADAFDDLEPAFSHRFLDEVGDSPGWFRFTHALVREVLVNEITTLHEARLHLRVADAIEARSDLSDSDIEILAEHLYAARSLGVGLPRRGGPSPSRSRRAPALGLHRRRGAAGPVGASAPHGRRRP